MNILMLNYEYPPIGGGTGNACFYLIKEFQQRADITITLVTFSPDTQTRIVQPYPNCSIHYVNCGTKTSLHHWTSLELLRWLIYTYHYLAKHLEKQRYDLIHCWSGWPAGILGLSFRRYAPYIIALRGSDVPGHTPRTAMLDKLFLRRLSARIWTRAAKVTTVSHYLANLASQTAKCDFEVINNGVDRRVFYPTGEVKDAGPLRLIYVGRLSPHKGIEDLLKALALLLKQLGSLEGFVSCTIVGSGALQAKVVDIISDTGLGNIVTLTGAVNHDTVPRLIREHDVMVFPCHSDAMANVVLEAIASGLAIISTRTGGSEVINGNGLLINTHDPKDIATKLHTLLTETGLLAKLKSRSIELAAELGWDVCRNKYAQLYEEALAKQR